MAKVTVRKLIKRFGDLEAVKNASFVVEDGEFAVLLGPSGCGKTTMLRCIAGLEQPDDGAIFFDDYKVNDLTPAKRNIAFVFQFYALYPHLNIWDNVAFPLRASHVDADEIKERVNQVLNLLELEDVAKRRASALTPGQRQRAALGRAIVRQPRVFLLDEPLSNLDAKLRERMRAELKRLFNDIGATTLCVTHDQVEAMSMADKIILMKSGQIQQLGSPIEIYNNPANLFVANFIGSPGMNFLSCQYEQTDVKPKLVGEQNAFWFSLSPQREKILQELTDGKAVLGVRPEDVEFCLQKTPAAVEATVYLIEPLGSKKIVNLTIGDWSNHRNHSLLKVTTEPDFDADVGETLYVRFKKICVFDRINEKALITVDGDELWQ